MMAAALDYLAQGYPVFAVCSPRMGQHSHGQNRCTNHGKVPLVAWAPFQERLPTETEVRSWWTRWPIANIGLATGVLSGVLVLDADGTEARKACLQRGGLDQTPTVWTGKVGGAHFHLAYPGGDIRNFARKLPGTDMRAQGGYVLLPPSVHASGNVYRWADHTQALPPAPVPDWLSELIHEDAAAPDGSGYAERDALDVDELLRGFDEGQRDTGLFKLACRLRHDDTPQGVAEALIREAARNCRPPFDETEAVKKVRYVYLKYEPGGLTPSVTVDEWFSPPGTTAPDPIADVATGDEERWTVYDAADFLAIEYPVVKWRVSGFLRDRAIMFNFGAPGSIKTYIATDAAIAVSIGGMFLGKYECRQGRVLIVQEDTLDSDFQQAYLGPLVRARGIDPEDLRGNLFVAPPGGMTLGIPERIQELCRWIEEYKPVLLVLDAFYLMHDGEGYGKDLSPIMKRLKAIRARYECAIWVIDHDRKGKAEKSNGENPIDRLWGGRQKSAAVDAIMESRPVKGTHGETFLDIVKLRGAKPAEPIRVKLHDDYRLLVEGEGAGEEVTPVGSKLTVYEWLCREGGSRTKTQIANGVDLTTRSIESAISELWRAGLVRKNGKSGRADTWIALRKSESEPQQSGPDFDWDEDE